MFEQPEKKESGGAEKSGISRREFLKMTGAAGAAAFAGFMPSLEIPRAFSKEVKEGDSWLEGLEARRNEALNLDEETATTYIQYSGGESAWKKGVGGEVANFSTKELQQEVAKNPDEIINVHTHPLPPFQEFGLTEEHIRAIRDGELEPPSMPPSRADVLAAIMYQDLGKESSARLSSAAVDLRGVWRFHADMESPFPQLALPILRWNSFLITNPNIKGALYSGTPLAELNKLTTVDVESLYKDAREAHDEFQPAFGESYDDLHNRIVDFVEKSIAHEPVGIQTLVEKYQELGVTVNFESFTELRTKNRPEGSGGG